ncbi:MAG TPA: cytochrome b/b6 domain-containing protein [Vicinamibacterales bacterium]|jgi:thiosulfate reductase cytochrome b subunit|nr:cytochrome b/b6 domain-containing protein [Vicinamibacterales bacterium]
MRVLEPHSALVRVTHWVNATGFAALLVSGVAILLAHPRLYWGETGAFGAPSLIDLPLPLVLVGQSGWGRSLHFLSAWVCVIAGLAYVVAGVMSGRLRRELLPAPGDLRNAAAHLRPRRPAGDDDLSYNPAQRLAYFTVVIVLLPAMIWTGLAMSPAVTSVAPVLVNVVGGQQSARTIHFAVACALVLFLAGHVAMVALSGFKVRMRGMITGRRAMDAGRA